MKDHNVKQYPITLTGMGGGVGSPRLHTAGGGGDDMGGGGGSPGTVNHTRNAPISFGMQFTRNNGNYNTWAEFQSNGSVLLNQNLWGEWKYDLSTPYDISSSSISYQANSARYWTIGQYQENALSSYKSNYGRAMRFDYDNDKGYCYHGTGGTTIVEDLDVYTQTTPTVNSSSSNPFGASPGSWGSISTYVRKSGGGVAFLTSNNSNKTLHLRNYTSETTTTVSSSSTLDVSSYDIGGIYHHAISTNGTTLSIWARRNSNSSQYDYYKWTLSTAFDLSSAGSPTVTGPGSNSSGSYLQGGVMVIDDAATGGRAIHHDQYGKLKSWSYTDSGDVSTYTEISELNRGENGGYLNGSSYGIWYNDGKKVIDQGYSSSHYVYDSTSNPYGWKFHNISFGSRSSGYDQIQTAQTNEGQTFSDGRFNATRSKLYSSYYCCGASSFVVTEGNLTTPGDITTLVSGYNSYNSACTFTGWTGGYTSNSGWYDKVNNKYHLADFASGQQYYIFDLNTSGEFTGTYDTTPTDFTPGDLNGKTQIQPLSHDGKYFVYYNAQTCYIIWLDYAFQPHRGFTQVDSFNIEYNLPNGSQRNANHSRMYVSSGRIFFPQYYETTITTVFDITIDGQAPDDVT